MSVSAAGREIRRTLVTVHENRAAGTSTIALQTFSELNTVTRSIHIWKSRIVYKCTNSGVCYAIFTDYPTP